MSLVTLHPDRLGVFMDTGLGIPHDSPPDSNAMKNPCQEIEYPEMEPISVYVVTSDNGELLAITTQARDALAICNVDHDNREVWASRINGTPYIIPTEPCEWIVYANGEYCRIQNKEEFVNAARRYHAALNNDRAELTFWYEGIRSQNGNQPITEAQIWESYVDPGVGYLKTRQVVNMYMVESNWKFKSEIERSVDAM